MFEEIKKLEKRQTQNDFIECPLCYELVESYRMACICFCGHEFCELCLVEYIQQKLKNFETIVCPAEGCEGKLDTDCGLMVSLTESEKKKYRQIKFRKFAEQNNWMLCPNQHCEEGTLKKHSTKRKGKCGKCKTIYCLKCMLPKHKGACQNMEEILLKHKYDFKKCPNCQRLVERNQGCRHMTCKCQSEFCYDCGGAWSGNHVCVVKEKINLEDFKQSEKQSEFDKQSEQQKQPEHEEQEINFPQPTYITQKIDIFLRKTCCFFFINKNYRRLSKCGKINWLLLTLIQKIIYGLLLLLWSAFCLLLVFLFFIVLFCVSFLMTPYMICKKIIINSCSLIEVMLAILLVVLFPIFWYFLTFILFCHYLGNCEVLKNTFIKGQFSILQIGPSIQIDNIFESDRQARRPEQEMEFQLSQQERKCRQFQNNEKVRDRKRQKYQTQKKLKQMQEKREIERQKERQNKTKKNIQWFFQQELEKEDKQKKKKLKQEEKFRHRKNSTKIEEEFNKNIEYKSQDSLITQIRAKIEEQS